MKSIAISGSVRQNVGKRDSKELRYVGNVPAVLYGGSTQTHLSVSAADLKAVLYTPEVVFIDLNLDGKTVKAIVQDAQFHPLTDLVTHIDFLELNDEKEVTINIPVKLTGTSPGVKLGGKLVQKLRKLRVKALPGDLPQEIEVPMESLEVGKSFRVAQVVLENAKVLNNSDDTIVSVIMSRALRQAEQEAAKATKGGKK
ncbi:MULTISPECIES: 50S ribosomal protein L25/general stress protein Ctc [Sphingobacterium]|jgi:large subunit ribosomal protein L25|uniref:50S ribosomal protein L25/general stress protein Ctc n=1 Tax=Sphingobacterium TaxID=28453 RepID=UPI0004E5F84E|nr:MULTISPECIES: 50S ribosomal protein L25/general stress protein Ctc [Sphingobacterium]CDS93993.1 50S ribosomal protein L25 [Sphingobacterium sp. PM2-P1-29]SJN51488.1 LSU ribosomal protein L25p [Sphingobacterium faecium PCAi_F2.5]UPZ38394.1 50S ribosomal protein L25/general stress protein Ctc [Sphingobacterium sp. PCS056]UXD69825.1 50S ribosomal protein L25/general stress protein Ctc [Sphingobacterium faecium]WGQ13373.1 50S ribosomal protein L25/general stress protein Ctc [Sphingobacterium fa